MKIFIFPHETLVSKKSWKNTLCFHCFWQPWHNITKMLRSRTILFSFERKKKKPPFFYFIHIFYQERRKIPQLTPKAVWPWWGDSCFPTSDCALSALYCWLWNRVYKIWCFLLPSDLFVTHSDLLSWESTVSRKMSRKCIEDAEGFVPIYRHFGSGSFAQHTVLQGVSTGSNLFWRTPPLSAQICLYGGVWDRPSSPVRALTQSICPQTSPVGWVIRGWVRSLPRGGTSSTLCYAYRRFFWCAAVTSSSLSLHDATC